MASTNQEEHPSVAHADALRCSKCDEAKPEEDFLLCDGCVQGFHAHCLNQDMPNSRFWFCPICAGTTIKGCLIKVASSLSQPELLLQHTVPDIA